MVLEQLVDPRPQVREVRSVRGQDLPNIEAPDQSEGPEEVGQ
jgi:hypothetical protein